MKRSFVIFSMILAMSLFLASLANALDVSADGLTKEQKAQIQLQIEQMKKVSAQSEKPTVQTANEWVDFGKNVALAFTTVAKDLGVAADTFLQSTTGKVTLVLIVWKVAGKDILGVIVGSSLLAILLALWVYFFRKLCVVKSITISKPETGFRSIKEIQYYREDEVDGTRFVMLLVLMAVVLTTLMIIF